MKFTQSVYFLQNFVLLLFRGIHVLIYFPGLQIGIPWEHEGFIAIVDFLNLFKELVIRTPSVILWTFAVPLEILSVLLIEKAVIKMRGHFELFAFTLDSGYSFFELLEFLFKVLKIPVPLLHGD